MLRRALSVILVLGLAIPPATALPQETTADPEVARGIRQVEEGDYDAAILTLDQAARRLAPDPKASRELGQAYLYLGIAYLGKGHEAVARTKFREAVTRMDVSLTPDKFPPRVIDLVEAVRQEAQTSTTTAPAAVLPAVSDPPESKGGGKKWLWIGLGVVAAGTAAYFATKGPNCFGRSGLRARPDEC